MANMWMSYLNTCIMRCYIIQSIKCVNKSINVTAVTMAKN